MVIPMTPDELRAIINFLRERVQLEVITDESSVAISFIAPTSREMIDSGLNPGGVRQLLQVSWWDEMVTDIIETPDFCEPEDSREQVLEYAKDVVSDYIQKRFRLDEP